MSDPATTISEATKAQQFNKVLNQRHSRNRTPEDVQEGLRKLRKLVLLNGIPSEVVGILLSPFQARQSTLTTVHRILLFDPACGNFSYASTTCLRILSSDMLLVDHAMSGRRFATIHLGGGIPSYLEELLKSLKSL